MIRKLIKRYTPKGCKNDEYALSYLKFGLCYCVIIALLHLWNLMKHVVYILQYVNAGKTEGYLLLGSFHSYFDGIETAFIVYMLISPLFLFLNVRYLKKESNAFYLLKRLPDRKELFRETVAMTLLMLLVFLVSMIVVMLICYLIYVLTATVIHGLAV